MRRNWDACSLRPAVASAYAAFNPFRGDLQVSILQDVIELTAAR